MATIEITEDLLRSRLGELRDKRKVVETKMAPLDKQREDILKDLQPLEEKLRKLDARRADVKQPLFDIDNEISRISRLLPTDRSVPPVDVHVVEDEKKE